MTEQQLARKAHLLSKGALLVPIRPPEQPGTAGDPYISSNGLRQWFVERQVRRADGARTFEIADDPDGLLQLAASEIRWSRFYHPKYDQDQTFPVTRRLAYAAFPDLRPKNQLTQASRR